MVEKIALRNLGRQKLRTTLLSLAILGSFVFILLVNGFVGSIILNIGQNASHLFAGHLFIEGQQRMEDPVTGESRKDYYIKDPGQIEDIINESGLEYRYMSRRSMIENCTLIFEGSTVNQGVIGADWERESFFIDRIPIQKGAFSLIEEREGIIISKAIADKLKADVGDNVIGRFKTVYGQYNAADFKIVGITSDSGLIGASLAYADLGYVNELINLKEDQYMTLGLYFDDMNQDFKRLDKIADNLYEELEKEVVLFDRDKAKSEENPIHAMMKMLQSDDWTGSRYVLSTLNDVLSVVQEISLWVNIVGYIVLVIMLLVVLIGLFNTFWIVMLERTKEIGTIRAVGMQRPAVFRMLLTESVLIGVIGMVVGTLLSFGIMFIVSRINFGTDSIFFIIMKNGHITFYLPWWQAVLNISIVFMVTLLGALIPAVKASRLNPAEAFQSIH